MKTTLDLPDELMRSIKLRAVEENRTLTDLIADLLRRGLSQDSPAGEEASHLVKFPLILGGHPAKPDQEITPERAAEILLQQDVEHYDISVR